MKIEHLEERVSDYKASIETVIAKKTHWSKKAKPLIVKTLKEIANSYTIGWKVQELNWIYNNEAINISFESFPLELMECTNQIPTYQFIPGGALVFSQTYSGDVYIFISFPELDHVPNENNLLELGSISPLELTEKVIIENVDEFLKEMIQWELPNTRKKVGFSNS